MALSKKDIERKLGQVTGELIKEKGYICFVDVFQKLGYLSKEDYEAWRMKKHPHLERCIKVNLGKVKQILDSVRRNSTKGKLKPSMTVYKSWGKGAKIELQFSKSGDQYLERLYSTHYLKARVSV